MVGGEDMDTPITRAEHEEFRRAMETEKKDCQTKITVKTSELKFWKKM